MRIVIVLVWIKLKLFIGLFEDFIIKITVGEVNRLLQVAFLSCISKLH